MLGKRSAQRGLFEADHLHLGYVGKETFYGFLASQRNELFRDEDYAEFYCPDNGRTSVAPSLLATALLLQTYEGVSDEEAKARADYDLRWKVALGVGVEERPFAKSTLQLFRARLILNEKMRAVFGRSLAYARETGYLQRHRLTIVLDTTYILGRGAVKDTYNLLADGMRQLIKALAEVSGESEAAWSEEHGMGRYLASSIKGEATLDWDDEAARHAFLQGIVVDAERLVGLRHAMASRLAKDDPRLARLMRAAEVLDALIEQDVERDADGTRIKQGVASDRMVSVHDPDMRHGRKSRAKRFDGHKAAIAVDAASQLITAVEVLPGNTPDATQALELTSASETSTGLVVAETVGDCAYGDGGTRQAFAEAGRPLIAKVPARGQRDQLAKEDFVIDLEGMTCTCPAGCTTSTLIRHGSWIDSHGERQPAHAFQFATEACAACQLRPKCIKAKSGRGRTIHLHPQEPLLQAARALQKSPAFSAYRRKRQVAEHRLARLVQLGIRQARYFGRAKTLYQLLMAATVANLTLVAGQVGQIGTRTRRPAPFLRLFHGLIQLFCSPFSPTQHHPTQFLGTQHHFSSQMPTFRLGF
jgi:transposase